MNNLRKIVYNKLLNVPSLTESKIFYAKAPQGSALPYVVFSFPSTGRKHKGQEDKVLEINIYDCERDNYNVADSIEQQTDDIDAELDYSSEASDGWSYWFRRTSRISVPYSQESNIWRRELRYSMKAYDIGE